MKDVMLLGNSRRKKEQTLIVSITAWFIHPRTVLKKDVSVSDTNDIYLQCEGIF
jgi:hypothetical protein